MSFPYNSNNIGNRIIKPIQNDAVNRLRVSAPQSLIDTDFEYSLQPTKWETLELMSNIPSIFVKNDDLVIPATSIVGISAISTSFAVAVSTVPINIGDWPDPQTTVSGPISAGWTRIATYYPNGESVNGFTSSQRQFTLPFTINVGSLYTTSEISFEDSGVCTIGAVGVYGTDSYYARAGVLIGAIKVLSAGPVINPTYGGTSDANWYLPGIITSLTNPLYNTTYQDGIITEGGLWNTSVLSIINDGRVGAGGYIGDFMRTNGHHTGLRRIYSRRFDQDTTNDRIAYYVFAPGPGNVNWSGTTYNTSSQAANYGNEPSRTVWEVYRFQNLIKVTTVKGVSGLDPFTQQSLAQWPNAAASGPQLRRSQFTQFGINYGTTIFYDEGLNSTATNQLQGSAKLISYGAVGVQGDSIIMDIRGTTFSTVTAGNPIYLSETSAGAADGLALITAISALPNGDTRYTLIPRRRTITPKNTNIANQNTLVYSAGFYTNAEIRYSGIIPVEGTNQILVNTSQPHNMYLGQPIYIVDRTKTDSFTFPYIGSFVVNKIVDRDTFGFTSNLTTAFGQSSFTESFANTKLYVRPEGIGTHRSTDGGVQITTANNVPYSQIIRQTRNYFRYQSGKGILYATGILFKPSYDISSFTVNTLKYIQQTQPVLELTCTTEQPHGFKVAGFLEGPTVRFRGFTVKSGVNRYNDTFAVSNVANENTFTVQIPVSSNFSSLYQTSAFPMVGDINPGGIAKVDVINWNDAVVRSGMFDEQNGIFFESDGQSLRVGKRTSTLNLNGTVSITNQSSVVVGSNTKFTTSLAIGNYVVIRGISFTVTDIQSDTSMTVAPVYNGTTSAGVKISKTVDTMITQQDFNLDKLDGSGPSGYVIDLNRMQMIYFDYSWYGAGRIRWGVRDTNGDIIYCHEMPNNNVNTEAYMRSGNLPARFEIVNKPQQAQLMQASNLRVSVTNTLALSTAVFSIKRAFNPNGPYTNLSPVITGNLIPFEDINSNIALQFPLNGNLLDSGRTKTSTAYTSIAINPGSQGTTFFSSLCSKFPGRQSLGFSWPPDSGSYLPCLGASVCIPLGGTPWPYFGTNWTAEIWCNFYSFLAAKTSTYSAPDSIIFGFNSYPYYFGAGFYVKAQRTANSTTAIRVAANANPFNTTYQGDSLTNCLTLSTWHHIAFQKRGTNVTCFVDGVPRVQISNYTDQMGTVYSYYPWFIGGEYDTQGCNGTGKSGSKVYLQDFRFVGGAAVYPDLGFTPPTEPLPTSQFFSSSYYLTSTFSVADSLSSNRYYKGFVIQNGIESEVETIQTVLSSASAISVTTSSSLPTSGTILIGSEYINYRKLGINTNNEQVLSLVNRNIAGAVGLGNAPATEIPLIVNRQKNTVRTMNNNCSPALSHWGTAVVMDGNFNEDKSYLFTASMSAFALPQNMNVEIPLLSVRLAPAADYGIGSTLGLRNLINRSSIILNDIQVVSRQAVNISVKMNCESPLWGQQQRWAATGNGSIAQYMDHSLPSQSGPLSGGVVVGGFFAGEQDVNRNQVTEYPIDIIRNLGNSILGGDTVFPNGPDILTVFARPFSTSAANRTLCKISWLESQG
jgi:hypothetical protein